MKNIFTETKYSFGKIFLAVIFVTSILITSTFSQHEYDVLSR